MPRDETLARIRGEIEAGDLGRARDRFHGLIATYPGDLLLRRELGEVYWALQDRAMAGRYWYLVEDKTREMREAAAAFERACGGSASQVLRALKVRAEIDSIEPRGSRTIFEDLCARAGHSPPMARRKTESEVQPGLVGRILQLGCMILLAAVAILSVIGLVSILSLFH